MRSLRYFGRWWPVLVIVLVTLATRMPYFGDPASSFDEQLYNLIGHRMLSGSLPYVDVWDRKPIGLFLLYAASNWAAAMLGISTALSYQLLATGFGLAGALLTWHLAARVRPGVAAMAAGAIYPLLMARFGSQAGQSEAFFVPLMTGAVALIEKAARAEDRRAALKLCLGAMLVCGVALQVKYTVAMQCVFLGLASLWVLYRQGYRPARLAAVAGLSALLGVLPTAVVWAWYAAIGHSAEFVFANFISIFDRGAPAEGKIGRLIPYLWMPGICIVFGIAVLIDRRERPSATYLLYTGWTLSCLAGLFMGSTIYAYYLAAMVPAVLLMAVPALALFGPVAGLALVGALLLAYDIPGRISFSQKTRAALAELARVVDPHIGKHDHCLYVFDGPSALYDATDSCLPTRFIYPDHLNNELEHHSLGIDQAAEVHRIFANKPGAVVTANRPVTVQNPLSGAALKEELARAYRPLAKIPFNGRILTISVRKDEDAPKPAPAGS
ncbi:MAG: hypothetical protein P0Y56_04765 [Candidatus Andeanibacterium colombiense]|uniref:Glycosyltransferase RgtA/B/C/D-like domain-containing protein n=1 Tax=Candidatus Andeanibacterium colombiense TaxID=3121345 RepID=A0AAJ5X7W0_9SPHN|nr:MAG: hypothetical protein P0Y56_04765 [Sphingomonadaceae bacterium]